jgi:ABC-three component (ABC-3C) system Middle Component 3
MNWQTRPIEIANLLNPAFYSLILRESSEGFIKRDEAGIPYSLIFLIPSFVLHEKTRNLLPSRRSTTPFGQWLMRNEAVKIGFADRTKQLIPYTKEALLFGIQHGVLVIDNRSGNLLPTGKQIEQPSSWSSDSIPKESLNKARLVGQWFAEIGDSATIYRVLGIRP